MRAPRSRTSTSALHVLLALVLGLGGCVCSGVNRGDVNLISLDQEWEMGRQLSGELGRELRLVDDPVVRSYIETMGQALAAETDLAERPWSFYVVDDPTVNAFAIPGGHVYVNAGLIEAAASASELAGVVGHEVAHGAARHGTERMTKVYGINALLSLIVGQETSLFEQIVAQVLGTGAVARFSRNDEREADRLGLRLMHSVGYEPEGMATMFETLLEQRRRRPNSIERFFASHPLTEDRIEDVRARVETLEGDPNLRREAAAFDEVKTRLARRMPSPARP